MEEFAPEYGGEDLSVGGNIRERGGDPRLNSWKRESGCECVHQEIPRVSV